MENMEIYNKYKTVPDEAMKAFNNGKFKGTDINTMWRIRSLTEQFGPCGIGWYFNIKRTWIEETKNNEQFAFAEIELFVKVDGEWSKPISGNGGNKLLRLKSDGEVTTSDEAYKMAVTDALGVACRNLGIGADVYWSNDKSKYDNNEDKTQKNVQEALRTLVNNVIKKVGSTAKMLEFIPEMNDKKLRELIEVAGTIDSISDKLRVALNDNKSR